MMRDTVREELQSKITPCAIVPPDQEPGRTAAAAIARPAPPMKRVETAGLVAPKTSPTLVEFQNKNAPLPDWRIQLQNAVKQRKVGDVPAAAQPLTMSSAAPAVVEQPETSSSDPRVANAMKRIEMSQKTFERPETKPRKAKPPFGIVPSSQGTAAAAAPARIAAAPAPVAVRQPIVQKRETNKLPLLERFNEIETPTGEIKKPFTDPVIARVEKLDDAAPKLDFPEATRIEIKADRRHQIIEAAEDVNEDIEDLAPISMRFGAGLFDMIIAGFISLLVLSPFAFAGSDFWNFKGLAMFAAAVAAIAFVYMTLCLGFFGKTMGMRLFSLELVDAVENEYPTLRQAAVNSFFFLVTLPLAGAGFLTAFFNEESRAVHDLLSGTIMVKEF
jgi:uncharacterized RDD family membrane protein YckC